MTIKNLNPRKLLSALIGCLNRLVRVPYQAVYGVRGGLRPPTRPYNPTRLKLAGYLWRRKMWQMESKIYNWTGLPDRWNKWFRIP